jgi:hypothetical protein
MGSDRPRSREAFEAAFWPVCSASSEAIDFLRKLRRKSFLLLRQPDPLSDVLVALKRGQFGAGEDSSSLD